MSPKYNDIIGFASCDYCICSVSRANEYAYMLAELGPQKALKLLCMPWSGDCFTVNFG